MFYTVRIYMKLGDKFDQSENVFVLLSKNNKQTTLLNVIKWHDLNFIIYQIMDWQTVSIIISNYGVRKLGS